MSLKEEDLQMFIQLGLTNREADIYLTLCKLKQATVKKTAKKLQIARAEIYRAIPTLEKLGLVERVINTPLSFRATPIAEGLSILLQYDFEKHHKMRAKANNFVKTFNENNIKEPSQEDSQCALIFEDRHLRRNFVKRMTELQTSMDAIVKWGLFTKDVSKYTSLYEEALVRGVKMRHITYLPKDQAIPEIFRFLKTRGSFEVKYMLTPPPTDVGIFDKKTIDIATSQKSPTLEHALLMSNDPYVVATCRDYFELKWRTL